MIINPTDILMVAALPAEFTIDSPCTLVYTGIGKVHAAANLSKALMMLMQQGRLPKLIINVGSAGSAVLPKGTVAHCSVYHQHDFDLGPLAHLLPALPIYSFGQQLATLGLSDGLYQAHTGDQFVTYANAYQVVDMESYALAAVAAAHEIAFTAFKYITDGTNDDSAMDWIKAVKHVENRLHAAVMEWLGQF